jgi:hypothetical protein
MPDYPMPDNANVKGCEWYGDARIVPVHLWADPVRTTDSYGGGVWQVRKCVVCGTLDTAGLKAQYEQGQYKVGRYA